MSTITRTAPSHLAGLDNLQPIIWRLHLLRAAGAERSGSIVRLPFGRVVVGRAPSGGGLNLTCLDPVLSRSHFELKVGRGGDSVTVRDLNSRNGTFVGGQPTTEVRVGDGAVIRAGGLVAVLEADPGDDLDYAEPTAEVPGRSVRARAIRAHLALAAQTADPVLIVGPTGSGKESAAAELHRRSGCRGALLRVNVAALPSNLFESELFGHVRGAFTGANVARPGLIRQATGGTLVLDEIGELPLSLQSKLLRPLDGHPIRAIGGSEAHQVDVRFVASTNADIDTLVAEGLFRQDLAARLRGQMVRLPSLRDRRADLLDLADAISPYQGRNLSWRLALSADAAEALVLCDWRDNLRGLKSALSHVRLMAKDRGGEGAVTLQDLPLWVLQQVRERVRMPASIGITLADEVPQPPLAPRMPPAEDRTAAALDVLLIQYGGNITALAGAMGVHRNQIYRWCVAVQFAPEKLATYRDKPNPTKPSS